MWLGNPDVEIGRIIRSRELQRHGRDALAPRYFAVMVERPAGYFAIGLIEATSSVGGPERELVHLTVPSAELVEDFYRLYVARLCAMLDARDESYYEMDGKLLELNNRSG
jgi:hypothetical protein